MKDIFQVGQKIKAINNLPLEGNSKAPKLIVGDIYEVKEIILDKEGHQHLDVGLASPFEYVRSWETKEELPKGDSISWCHPSRFELVD